MKEIFTAITEVARVVFSWTDPEKRKEAYRLHLDKRRNLALDAAEKYIQVNEKEGEFKNITEERKQQLLIHYRKRFFAWN